MIGVVPITIYHWKALVKVHWETRCCLLWIVTFFGWKSHCTKRSVQTNPSSLPKPFRNAHWHSTTGKVIPNLIPPLSILVTCNLLSIFRYIKFFVFCLCLEEIFYDKILFKIKSDTGTLSILYYVLFAEIRSNIKNIKWIFQ